MKFEEVVQAFRIQIAQGEIGSDLVNQWIEENSPDDIDPELIYKFSQQRGLFTWHDGQFLTPEPLSSFIAKIASSYQVESVLDPVCGSGLLLNAVALAIEAKRIDGVEINEQSTQLARKLLPVIAKVHFGDALSPQLDLANKYDLIVADPPLGMKLQEHQVFEALGSGSKCDFAHALTVWAAERLTKNGAAIILVSPSFFFSMKAEKIHKAIADVGCHIRAAIHLPGSTLKSTGIDTYLAIIEHGDQDEVFIAQYQPNEDHQDRLLSNLHKNKPGPQPALGRLCTLHQFNGFDSLVAQERLGRLAKKSGWKGKHANEIIVEIESIQNTDLDKLEHGSSSLYLRKTGRFLAATDLNELTKGRKSSSNSILHMHLADGLANPQYMAHWFNSSQIGRATLDSIRHGSTIPHINQSDLMNQTFFLPPIEKQIMALEGATNLQRIRAETDELESSLWGNVENIDETVRSICTINQTDSYEDWIESMPFPLASILWRDRAKQGSSYAERFKTLLHFFEATAAFVATIHLSAYLASEELWGQHGNDLNQKLCQQHLSLDHATFGAWKFAAEYLSKKTSSLIKDGDKSELLQRVYGTSNLSVLEMLSASKLRSVLQRANKIRNDWGGHSGAVSEEKAKQIHDELMELVYILRGLFGRSWNTYELIQSGSANFVNGIFHTKSKRLMGTRSSPFEEVIRKSKLPLESHRLYLFDSMSQSGLQLEPFIRVMPSPEKRTNACFIFSKHDTEQSRYVSYHFEQESEISEPYSDIKSTLEKIHMFDEVES